MADTRILLISGSTRSGSGNTAALRTVRATAPEWVTAADTACPGSRADARARLLRITILLTVNLVMRAMGGPGRLGAHGSERRVEADQYR